MNQGEKRKILRSKEASRESTIEREGIYPTSGEEKKKRPSFILPTGPFYVVIFYLSIYIEGEGGHIFI